MSLQYHPLRIAFLLLLIAFSQPFSSHAGVSEAYQQAIQLAAQGQQQQASTALAILLEAQSEPSGQPSGRQFGQQSGQQPEQQSVWSQRMRAAQQLIDMRIQHASSMPPFSPAANNPYINLANTYIDTTPLQQPQALWPATLLATLFPGAGHAWQGRWHGAFTAALIVWPMLLLTLWALKRGMGPVTVFFALITIWLWSGSVFSALSLAERGNLENYIIWWQNIWLASALPGRPW